ncbi:MAG: zinc-ribbon domain containing protein [Chryseobacterium sp.]|jgi:hypothetical protein|uniref:zinc-ribbon domain containing protein n=1 Tax=Chryseobacterium sp. TaxID=1871047 RepID=UPI0028216083|nr:zinc-ribbon domain containing protein [Chryseobacterium sp.]MDR2237389.1 zinc-ribbon domain containing protein [Chryseobacterium sp.]
MKRKQNKYARCPCCFIEKHRTEISVCLPILEHILKKQLLYYKDLSIDAYDVLINDNLQWACDDCLNSKKAILAFPALQHNEWNSHLAYYDTDCICRNCDTDFKFTKEEKKLWYETLRFRIESKPVSCLVCRKKIRQLKIENNTLSELFKKEITALSPEELGTVIRIYTQWGKTEKTKYYERLLKKKLRQTHPPH